MWFSPTSRVTDSPKDEPVSLTTRYPAYTYTTDDHIYTVLQPIQLLFIIARPYIYIYIGNSQPRTPPQKRHLNRHHVIHCPLGHPRLLPEACTLRGLTWPDARHPLDATRPSLEPEVRQALQAPDDLRADDLSGRRGRARGAWGAGRG